MTGGRLALPGPIPAECDHNSRQPGRSQMTRGHPFGQAKSQRTLGFNRAESARTVDFFSRGRQSTEPETRARITKVRLSGLTSGARERSMLRLDGFSEHRPFPRRGRKSTELAPPLDSPSNRADLAVRLPRLTSGLGSRPDAAFSAGDQSSKTRALPRCTPVP
jgi:hypothetical protein